MFPNELRSARERRLRVLAFVISAIAWVAVVASIIGIIYGAFIALAVAIAHALWLGHVRGNGVRLGPQQLPQLWNKVTAASQRVGLREPPATYLMQSGGVLNAFATKLFGRRFVILNSALVDACERGVSGVGPTEIDFVIAHETAHLAAGHLSWFLLPVRIIPLLGPAWSRACEYTCDRAGQAFVGNLETSSRALAILAAGARAGRSLDLDQFVAQRDESGRFWMAVYELNSTHPYLPKRIAALREAEQPGAAAAVGRNVVAYPLAPLFGMFAGGGAGSAGLFVVAMIGMMASIALPSFERYIALSRQAAAARSPAPTSARTMPTASASDDQAVTPAGLVRGDRFDWTVKLPGPKWELLPTTEARKQNQLADRWITRRDLDAHVMIVDAHAAITSAMLRAHGALAARTHELVAELERMMPGRVSTTPPDRVAYARDLWPRGLIGVSGGAPRAASARRGGLADLDGGGGRDRARGGAHRHAASCRSAPAPACAAARCRSAAASSSICKRMRALVELDAARAAPPPSRPASSASTSSTSSTGAASRSATSRRRSCARRSAAGWRRARPGQFSTKYGKIEDMVRRLTFVDGRGDVHTVDAGARARPRAVAGRLRRHARHHHARDGDGVPAAGGAALSRLGLSARRRRLRGDPPPLAAQPAPRVRAPLRRARLVPASRRERARARA